MSVNELLVEGWLVEELLAKEVSVRETLMDLEPGDLVNCRNLTMIPLLGEDTHPADYLTLDEALSMRTARVTEVSEGGSVPELRFVNTGSRQVLLMDGEEVVGAKQNRTLNISILAPAPGELLLPVTCVEAGRWAGGKRRIFCLSPCALRGRPGAQTGRRVCIPAFLRWACGGSE